MDWKTQLRLFLSPMTVHSLSPGLQNPRWPKPPCITITTQSLPEFGGDDNTALCINWTGFIGCSWKHIEVFWWGSGIWRRLSGCTNPISPSVDTVTIHPLLSMQNLPLILVYGSCRFDHSLDYKTLWNLLEPSRTASTMVSVVYPYPGWPWRQPISKRRKLLPKRPNPGRKMHGCRWDSMGPVARSNLSSLPDKHNKKQNYCR